MLRILFLPRYGPKGSSSRYRIYQYLPLLERAGHCVEVRALLNDGYLEELYSSGQRGWRWLATGYWKRLLAIPGVRHFDAVVCEQEVLPFLPALVDEFVARLAGRMIVDYDDAAYRKYDRWPFLRNKIPRLMAAADTVVVGNSHLAGYARQFTPRVSIVPTVVDLARYPQKNYDPLSQTIRVGWIGTPITAPFLNPLIAVMARLQQKYSRLVFRFIGAGDVIHPNGMRTEVLDWSADTEAKMLGECDVGIMPLPDKEFTRGKCGLKLIQYMACGLPVVASPVGANRDIVEDNVNGFLAASEDEWFEKLDHLIEDPALRGQLGRNGHAKVAAQYSLEHGLSKWLEILQGTSTSR